MQLLEAAGLQSENNPAEEISHSEALGHSEAAIKRDQGRYLSK